MQVGTYVVYLQNGDMSRLGENRKDIWNVTRIDRFRDRVELESLSRQGHIFETGLDRAVPISKIRAAGKFKKEYFNGVAYSRYMQNNTEDKTMRTGKNDMVDRTISANTDAAKVAATLTAGKTLNSVVSKKVTPQLPLMVRGYADTAIGRVVIANIADFAVKQFMSGNAKATFATEAMMQSAMLELMDTFDLESIVNEVLDSVVIDLEADKA